MGLDRLDGVEPLGLHSLAAQQGSPGASWRTAFGGQAAKVPRVGNAAGKNPSVEFFCDSASVRVQEKQSLSASGSPPPMT